MLVKRDPKLKKTLKSICKTSNSNINLSFENEGVKQLFRKNKINDNFKIIEEPENGNLDYCSDEVQTLRNDEFGKTLDGGLITPLLVEEKELEAPIIATIVILKRKQQKIWAGGSL